MKRYKLRIPISVGRLETVIDDPETERRGLLLVAHPHPLHGGSLENKVVTTLARAANEAGRISGEELHELRRVVAPLPDKLNQMEQRDPSSLSFTQAARLVGMGASVDDLTHSCGLTQAEAELVSRLHKAPKQRS